MLLSLIVASLILTSAPAQDPSPAAKPAVEVPTFANATCPIMGKKVSMPLFVDTVLGRFYVCCKPCFKKILADVPAAHKTAYPVVETVKNTACPVSGEAIGEDAVEVTLQGYRFSVCCAGCVDDARKHSQVTLAKLTRTTSTDVGNATCPVTGNPVAANAFALVGDALVHLATPKAADELAKDPAAVLAKAQAIAKSQPPKPKHEHRKAPAAPEAGK
jgi:hypothetical protein